MNLVLLASVLLPVTLLFGSGCHAASAPVVGEQHISVNLVPATHVVQGESRMLLDPHGADRVVFALDPHATVTQVRVGEESVPVDFSAGIVRVALPVRTPGELAITIRYRAVYHDKLPGPSAGTEDPTYGIQGVISPEGIFLGSGVAWYPRPSVPPARRTLEVTAPAGFEAVTAGRRVARRSTGESTVSVWQELHPVEQLSLSAGRYTVSESTAGPLPLYAYLGSGNAHLAADYREASGKYLKLYEELFGPYPFEKFAVVENFFPTGYGFPSYTLLGTTVLRLPFILTTSLPHEIAHNWWGNGVLVDYREGNWSEGLVTYLADHLLEERKSAALGRDYRYRILTDFASLVSPANDFPLAQFIGRSDPQSRSIGYGKGAMLFHMVRSRVGDQAFFGALRELVRERMYRPAAWSDFGTAFSRAAGQEVSPMIEQWLHRSGGPQLALAAVAVRETGGKWLLTGTITQQKPYWEVQVPLAVQTAAGTVKKSIAVKDGATAFSFPLQEGHGQLLLDPDADLFRVLSKAEIPPAVSRIKGSRTLLVLKTAGCRAGSETLQLLLQSLGQGQAQIVSEERLTLGEAAKHDLFICGSPKQKELRPPLPQEIELLPEGFSVSGTAYRGRDATLLAVAPHPLDPDHVAALYLPASESAAAASLNKISHYGKYSYLAFDSAENRAKGLSAAAWSGSLVRF